MSTENLPVQWQEEMAREAKEVAELERQPVGKISLRAGMMTYMSVPVPNNTLDVVVLGFGFERRYDSQPFNEGNIQPPDCFALSIDGKDMVPFENVLDKQHDTCDGCPQNSWVDNPRKPGKKMKRCKERRRLIVLPASGLEDAEKAEIAMITIPVTSLGRWATYVNQVAAAYKRPPRGMVTRISVKPNVVTQIEVNFEPVSEIQDQYLAGVYARSKDAEEAILTPYDVVPMNEPKEPAPQSTKY